MSTLAANGDTPEFTSDDALEFAVFTPDDDDAEKTELERPSLAQLTNAVRRSTRTLYNRLHSIAADARFVAAAAEAYGLPLVANARAGDWYVPPPAMRAAGYRVYFKSTDGHAGEWGFSLRRLNLGLLAVVARHGGAVVVDSTRRGKRFPDALAKTLPIWVAVLNAALFPERFPAPVLHTSPQAVPPAEAAAIERLLPRFLRDFQALGLTLPSPLTKPLRPLFVSPASPLPPLPPVFADFTPLVLLAASRVVGGRGTEGEYIQGAGDDHEAWAASIGLTPAVFWAHHTAILAATPAGLAAAVAAAVAAPRAAAAAGPTLVSPTENIFIASVADLSFSSLSCSTVPPGRTLVNLSAAAATTPPAAAAAAAAMPAATTATATISLPILADKRGHKPLRQALPSLIAQLRGPLAAHRDIVFVCDSGDHVAPAVALAVLCLFYDDSGLRPPPPNLYGRTMLMRQENLGGYVGKKATEAVDKALVKRRLAWIAATRPSANPARGLLNAVNSVIMGPGAGVGGVSD